MHREINAPSATMELRPIELDVFENVDREFFQLKMYQKRKPVILRGQEVGQCCHRWTPEYLATKEPSTEVKVHVSKDRQMDFINKNFLYRTLSFEEFIKRAHEATHKDFFIDETEHYYLRALGNDPRHDVADISVQFPQLSEDVHIPELFPPERFFSSVLRVASKGTQLWTHYDVMDNILIQIVGRKSVVLFPPSEVDNLYMNGDKSEVLDVDQPNLLKYPKFAKAQQYRGVLEPGDILFIPALWFHNMTYDDFGVAVNVFWKHLEDKLYDTKDPYGNRDPMPAQRACQIVDRAIKALGELPEEYGDFYRRRLCDRIQRKLCRDPEASESKDKIS